MSILERQYIFLGLILFFTDTAIGSIPNSFEMSAKLVFCASCFALALFGFVRLVQIGAERLRK